MEPEKEVRKSY